MNGQVTFNADGGVTGTELWISDGTTAGTHEVADINPGPGSSNPAGLTVLLPSGGLFGGGPSKAVFAANDGSAGTELWVTDGSAYNTFAVEDINPGAGSSNPGDFTSTFDGKVLFHAYTPEAGPELWVTNGTAAGTSLVKDIVPGPGSSNPGELYAIGSGKALFTANNTSTGIELWVTDGTTNGTYPLKSIDPGTGQALPANFGLGVQTANAINPFFFQANDGAAGTGLWVTNFDSSGGKFLTAGTSLIKDIDPGASASLDQFSWMIFPGGSSKEVFLADNAGANELWVTDSTPGGTYLVKTFSPGLVKLRSGNSSYGGDALLVTSSGGTDVEFWETDGTSAGTSLVKTINTGTVSSLPTALVGGLFVANDGANGTELWVKDSSAAGAHLVSDINPGAAGSYPSNLTANNTVTCFAEGTRIATEDGHVPVEQLVAGDRVRTFLDGPRDIVWIGHRDVRCASHPSPDAVWPILVSCGAFGPRLPERDLYLSPNHAIYTRGVLIPAKLLVNGVTIRQVKRARITYYHIELAKHDVLLAEGLPVESYLDTGDSSNFANGGATTVLHPDFAARTWEMTGCALIVLVGPVLDSVRNRLAGFRIHGTGVTPSTRAAN